MVRRLLRCLVVIVAIVGISGCGLIQIIDKPEAFVANPEGVGEVIRAIEINGLSYTDENFIREHLYSQPGQTYEKGDNQKDFVQLDGLGIFSSIQFETRDEGNEVVLVITVQENVPWLPSVALSITDENGVSIGPAVSFGNFMGRAMKLSASARFGGTTSYQATFLTPWYGDDRPQISAQIYSLSRQNKLDNFFEKSLESNLDLLWDIGSNYRAGPRLTFLQMNSDVSGITHSEDNSDQTYGAGFFIGRDTRNLLSYPTNGSVLLFDAIRYEGSLRTLRSNVDFRMYFEPMERHRLALYTLFTFSSGQMETDIPIWADFHIGGTNTVRGWELGSRRGKNQMLSVFEYGFMVLERKIVRIWKIQMDIGLQLAAFADVGSAWDDANEWESNLIAGTGIGARLIIPTTGMLRFDFAHGQPNIAIQFHIGSRERPAAQRYRVR